MLGLRVWCLVFSVEGLGLRVKKCSKDFSFNSFEA